MKNNIINKSLYIILSTLFIVCLCLFSLESNVVHGEDGEIVNKGLNILANPGTDGTQCFSAYYLNDKKSGAISFDLLKLDGDGYFGVFATNKDNLSGEMFLNDCILFDKTGNTIGIKIDNKSLFSFKEKTNYRFSFDSESYRLVVEVFDDELKQYKEEFFCNCLSKDSNTMGIIVKTKEYNSSSAIIDNVISYNENGDIELINDFNNEGSDVTLNKRFGRFYSNSKYGLIKKYDSLLYSITFVDIEGNIVSKQKVCAFGSAILPIEPPHVKGSKFVKWEGNYRFITSDELVVPIYVKEEDFIDGKVDPVSAILDVKGVNLVIEKNLLLNIYITLEDFTEAKVLVTFDGDTRELLNPVKNNNERVFTIDYIPFEKINDDIKLEIFGIYGGEEFYTYGKTFTILDYLTKLTSKSFSSLEITQEKYELLMRVIADIISFSSSVQNYKNYQIDSLVSKYMPLNLQESTYNCKQIDSLYGTEEDTKWGEKSIEYDNGFILKLKVLSNNDCNVIWGDKGCLNGVKIGTEGSLNIYEFCEKFDFPCLGLAINYYIERGNNKIGQTLSLNISALNNNIENEKLSNVIKRGICLGLSLYNYGN